MTGYLPVLDRPVDVAAQHEAVVHLDRHVPVDPHAVADFADFAVAHRVSPGAMSLVATIVYRRGACCPGAAPCGTRCRSDKMLATRPQKPGFIGICEGEADAMRVRPSLAVRCAAGRLGLLRARGAGADHAGDVLARLPRARPPRRRGTSRWRRATTRTPASTSPSFRARAPRRRSRAWRAKAAQFAFSDVAGLVAARANSAATAKMVAVIYQKAPYAIFSLRSGANVTKPEQLENLEIASGAGSFTQKVIEAFMKSKGLKADTVKYTNIDPAARVGMLAAKKIPAIETFAMSMPGVVKAAGGAGGADLSARQRRAVALLQRHPGARGLSEGRAPPR